MGVSFCPPVSFVRAEGEEFPALPFISPTSQKHQTRDTCPCEYETWVNVGKKDKKRGWRLRSLFILKQVCWSISRAAQGVLSQSIGKQAQKEKSIKIRHLNSRISKPIVHSYPKISCIISETLPLPLVLLPSPSDQSPSIFLPCTC